MQLGEEVAPASLTHRVTTVVFYDGVGTPPRTNERN